MSDLCSLINKVTGCQPSEMPVASKDPKGRYSRIRISLYDSASDVELHLAGGFIGVASITGGATCKIKLDYTHSGEIDLREVQSITSNFERVYVSTDGVGGIATLYICQSMETQIKPDATTAFTGRINNYVYNSTNIVRRVTPDYHYKANQIHIKNEHPTRTLFLGSISNGIPSTAYFRGYAYQLIAEDEIILSSIDMYYLGFVSAIDDNPVNFAVMASLL